MALAGPGAIQDIDVSPKPSLEDATEYEFVTILNPLTDDFAIAVAQDVPVNLPFEIRKDGYTSTISNTESDVRSTYGLALKNSDHQARKRIINNAIIRAGKTINLKGSEAKVAVRQLVNEIIQREGKKQFLTDPVKRKEVEDRIIISRGSIQELMDGNLRSTRQQVDEVISKSNEVEDEPFAGLKQTTGSDGFPSQNTTGDDSPQTKRIGRPPKEKI